MNNKIRIAIADDHRIMLLAAKEMLQDMGYEIVIEACNGQDLIAKIERMTPIPDLCLIDLNMPVMDGFAAIAELRRRDMPVKIIAHSMNNDAHYIAQAMRAGADSFFAKGDDPSVLRELIAGIGG